MEALHEDIFCPMHRRNHFEVPLAGPMPMLVPADEDDDEHSFYEVMPAPKPSRKLQWSDHVYLVEIENVLDLPQEEGSEDSYEIEIVDEEDGGDADFQLEIVDGEVYYVFETEDDVSIDSDEGDDQMDYESDSERTGMTSEGPPAGGLQLDFAGPSVDVVPGTIGVEENEGSLDVGSNYGSQRGNALDASIGDFSHHTHDLSSTSEADDDMVDLVVPTGNLLASAVTPAAAADSTSTISATEGLAYVAIQPADGTFGTPPVSSDENDCSKRSLSAPTSLGILKATLSPAVVQQQKVSEEQQQKKKKTKKAIKKTYVRADAFDGEHSPISWKKPKWAEEGPKLRSTGKADKMKAGNLASPITTATTNAKWDHDLLEDDSERGQIVKDDNGDEVELTGMNANDLVQYLASKGASGASLSRFKNKTQRKLKFTLGGASIREGGDIVKPITKATQYKKNVQQVADPKALKKTEGPTRKKYTWSVPEWTSKKLQDTGKGDTISSTGNLAAPITNIRETKKYEWEKPSWAKPRQNADVDAGMSSSKHKYTSPRQSSKPKIEWEKPSWAKKSEGSEEGDKILRKTGSARVSPTAGKPKIGWTRPSWAKNSETGSSRRILKNTEKGETLKQGGEIAKPVTKLPDMVKADAAPDPPDG